MPQSAGTSLKPVKRMPVQKALPKIGASDFTRDLDLSQDELLALLDLTQQVKSNPPRFSKALSGRYLSLLFEKPSLRTRITFELAIKQLGGDAILSNGPIGEREPLKDVARNLDRWTNAIVARTFSHQTIEDLAHWSSVPVINALSDRFHPCQALADIFTLQEKFDDLRDRKLAFVGDGNNVAHSLMLTALRMGMNFSIATPRGHEPDAEIIAQAEALAAVSGAQLVITNNPVEAVRNAHAVYTDVWISMGQENEKRKRLSDFAKYQVNQALLSGASADAVFMHCLPAKRDEEVTDEVLECPQSVVFDQAENRLHVQKALLLMLIG
ncbi:MAG TPA: ornithine carbamoyltransferase [Bryobacteraceae bacterium]|jgi:ornithine carbamoyltransferase|nr:ornithine carbamoyltransferase [Bryobacteraceae bacterium]